MTETTPRCRAQLARRTFLLIAWMSLSLNFGHSHPFAVEAQSHRPPSATTLYLPLLMHGVTASGYLLIPADSLVRLQQKVQTNAPEWVALLDNVNNYMTPVDEYASSPENIALVYLLTRNPTYAAAAWNWAQEAMAQNVRGNSYLYFGQYMRSAAIVLNYCRDALTPTQQTALVDYLDRWTHELWFDNQGSGWGLNDPGNNYHMSFLEGTAYAGYTLRAMGHPNANTYLNLLKDKLTQPNGVLNYLNTRAAGGDWHEGVNYGVGSKMRLFSTLSVIASMGEFNYFTQSPFFADSLLYAHYQLQPGHAFIYPGGDLARESAMPVTPFERDYLQTAVFWLPDSAARRHGQWYLENVVPDYNSGAFTLRPDYYKDMLYKLPLPSEPENTLPLFYHAPGTHWINVRSAWDATATSVSIAGAAIIDQSHAHHDTGSFVIWKNDWMMVDAVTYSTSGLLWSSDAHNMLHVDGSQNYEVPTVPGWQKFYNASDLAYIQVDGTQVFRYWDGTEIAPLLNEWTREFVYLKPDVLLVYDRVNPRPGSVYDVRFHFPLTPTLGAGNYTALYNGGGVALRPLLADNSSIVPDTDVNDGPSGAWRVQETSANGRFLNLIQVASGFVPTLTAQLITSTSAMEGLLWNDQVVLFSRQARGAPVSVPFSYTLPVTSPLTHTLFNMSGGYAVDIAQVGGNTLVTVSRGATYTATQDGIVQIRP